MSHLEQVAANDAVAVEQIVDVLSSEGAVPDQPVFTAMSMVCNEQQIVAEAL